MRLSRLPGEHEIHARDINVRSFEFAAAIMRLVHTLKDQAPAYLLNCLAEEGASVGEHVAEAHQSSSKRTYLSRMTSGRHAARRVQYWLRLLDALGVTPKEEIEALTAEAAALHTALNILCAKTRQSLDAETSA